MAKNKKGGKKSKQQQQQQQKSHRQQQQQEPPSSRNSPDLADESVLQQPGGVVEVHDGLTNTNTDKTCLDTKKPRPFRWFYQYNLWTGLYMLNPSEQAGFHVFGWLFAICIMLYGYVFFNGVRDGFHEPLQELME